MLVAEALTDSRQAHPVLHQRRRVAVAGLVQGALDTRLGTVACPSCLDCLVAKRLAIAVLQRPEQRAVSHLRLLEVAPQQAHQLRVVE